MVGNLQGIFFYPHLGEKRVHWGKKVNGSLRIRPLVLWGWEPGRASGTLQAPGCLWGAHSSVNLNPVPPERTENVGEKPNQGQALKETWARDKVLWALRPFEVPVGTHGDKKVAVPSTQEARKTEPNLPQLGARLN